MTSEPFLWAMLVKLGIKVSLKIKEMWETSNAEPRITIKLHLRLNHYELEMQRWRGCDRVEEGMN